MLTSPMVLRVNDGLAADSHEMFLYGAGVSTSTSLEEGRLEVS